jgi:O-antigen/teichoic acid export membrane protein
VTAAGANAEPVREDEDAPGAASASRAAALRLAPPTATQTWARRLAGNLAWNAASELTARGASLWLAFACARVLPVSAFGRFSFALALAQYAWLAGDSVANSGYATREVARMRVQDPGSARRLKGRILLLRLAAAAVLTAAFALVALVAPLPADLRGALLGASVFFLAYAAFPDWALRAREDFRGLALANTAGALALVAGTVFWLPNHAGAGVAAALWGGSFAVSAAFTLARLLPARAFTWHGEATGVGEHARRSAVFSLGSLAGMGCVQAPILIVGAMASAQDAGLFGAGYRFLLVVVNVFSVLWWPLMPVLVRSRPGERDFREALATMGGVVLLLGLPASLAFAMWPREVLTLAFGARYAAGAPALRIASVVLPLIAASALFEQTSMAVGREVARARVNAVALGILVTIGVASVRTRGPEGVAAALVVAYVVSVAGYAFTCRGVLPWRDMAARARLPLLLNAGLALAWTAARAFGAPALPSLLVAGAVYALVAVACGALRWTRPAVTGEAS